MLQGQSTRLPQCVPQDPKATEFKQKRKPLVSPALSAALAHYAGRAKYAAVEQNMEMKY